MFNSEGEVIAINSMQPSSADLRNFNYSIPINYFIKVADYLVTNRTSYQKTTLKIQGKSLCDYSSKELSTMGVTVKNGVHVVSSLDPLVAIGRIITHVNGEQVETLFDYEFELLKYNKGETITLTTTDIVGANVKNINVKMA